MNNDIKALLEKYYDGETSLEEESLISHYFALHPEEATTADGMLFHDINAVKRPADSTPLAKPRRIRFRRSLAIGGTAVAAGLALWMGLRRPDTLQQPTLPQQPVETPQTISTTLLVTPKVSGEIKDEQQALEQARKTLAYVSSKLNKGINGMSHLRKLEQSVSKIQNKEKS